MLFNEDVKEILSYKGLKNTRHRADILQILQNSQQPLSADHIFLKLQERKKTINLSTVYRILNVLTEKEILIRTKFQDKFFYEINSREHTHKFICSRCKKMFNIKGCPLEVYEKNIKYLGFEVTGHRLELYGFCRTCKKSKGKNNYNDFP